MEGNEGTPDGNDTLVFYCNGRKVVERRVDPTMTLLKYLRNKLLLTGSKQGCGEGGCGACTVMVSKYSPKDKTIRHFTVNACLAPICSVHNMAVTTVEGIGSTTTRLHPVQERLAKAHGSQCGFCTPGMVMSMYTLLRNKPQPTMEEIEGALAGNLCRCTGYRPILQGYKTFTKDGCCGGNDVGCCMNLPSGINELEEGVSTTLFDPSEFTPYDPSQEPIFPPELMLSLNKSPQKMLKFVGDQVTWFRPITLQKLLELKTKNPQAKLVVGNSDIGIEMKFKKQLYPVLIDCNHIPELTYMEVTSTGVRIGASVPLSSVSDYLKQLVQTEPEHKTHVFAAFVEILRWFAGRQIRNVACMAGSIASGNPFSDLNTLLLASASSAELISSKGKRTVIMDGNFFTRYKQNVLRPDEVILAINIPFTAENEHFYGYKQASRREGDIAIVNAGMRVVFKPGTNVVQDCSLAFGGMAATSVLATKTMKSIIGRSWDDGLVDAMSPLLVEDLPLAPGAPGGMEPYRQSLTLSFFFKFYLAVLEKINFKLPGVSSTSIPASYRSASETYHKNSSQGVQIFQEVPSGQPDSDAVGRPLTHQSALKQVTGEAIYVDDIPPVKGELYLGLVLSKKAHANILSVDATAALATEGVHAYVNCDDVPGSNLLGTSTDFDDVLFADKKVTCMSQLIGVIVADNQTIAQRAADLVRVEYEELPFILTLEEAIEKGSFFPSNRFLKKGDIDEGFKNSDHVIEGEVRTGAQEHFYLETFSTLVTPGEAGDIEVISSNQSATKTQTLVAAALGIASHKVVARVKRVGGAFGGKQMRAHIHAAMCAVAANKVKRPVRLVLDRHEDMMITGTRHPFLGRYKVGVTNSGQLTALKIDFYCNAGNTYDLSREILGKALKQSDNCYKCPNVELTGRLCWTNLPSSTSFRGFGAPQAMLVMETIMSDIACKCGLTPVKVRDINFYKEGDMTPFGQELKHMTLGRCWNQCLDHSDYNRRRRDVDQYNSENRWKKRGLAVTPTKYGITLGVDFLHQAGALVHIYTDGSVLVAHGGSEMGQGLHTKMIQVASRALRIPAEMIYLSETSTNTVPNASFTGASVTSDLNGPAVKVACETLLHRLEPFIQEDPKGSWESWVKAAYANRVSLSSTGFYKAPQLSYSRETGTGAIYLYFTYGVAVSEVEIDCLTGDHQVLRTDIVMDAGDSLNPAIDVGQIEGAFIQGYGMFVLEDYRVSPTGQLLTIGPRFYKIPSFSNIPAELNVSLLTRAPNPFAIHSSKGVGEPPLFLAASVFFAVKDAIQSARADAGMPVPFRLDSPATAERIRMACQDQFTQQIPTPEAGTFTPFFVRP